MKSENLEPAVIDNSLIFDGLMFATPLDRCRYIGTSVRDRPQWLKKNVGRWRRIEDVRQEAAPPGPPVESAIDLGAEPAGRNGQTSSPGVRDNGDNEDDVALVDTLAGDCSPPYQPASLPAPVNENLPSGSTQTELLPSAEAATRETKGPKTQTTPLGDPGRKRGRSGSRQLEKQKLPARNSKMRIVLGALKEYPILARAAAKAGIHCKTLAYWLKCSEAGHDGYDIEWQGVQWGFHEHCKSAIDEAHDMLREVVWQIAMGVIFKTDANGNFVVEAVGRPNPKMMRFYLEWVRPEKWGKHRKSDIPQTGGVLVIGKRTEEPENSSAASIKARKWKSVSRKVRGPKA